MTGHEVYELVFGMAWMANDETAKGYLKSASALLLMAFGEERGLKEKKVIPVNSASDSPKTTA